MRISDLLEPALLRVPMHSTAKVDVIRELVAALVNAKGLTDGEAIAEAVLARERLRSTGIGYGLAIPHAKCPGLERLSLVVGKPAVPIPFDSIDGRPVELIILVVSPPHETTAHVQTLARISRLWINEQFRAAVRAANDPDALLQAVRSFE